MPKDMTSEEKIELLLVQVSALKSEVQTLRRDTNALISKKVDEASKKYFNRLKISEREATTALRMLAEKGNFNVVEFREELIK